MSIFSLIHTLCGSLTTKSTSTLTLEQLGYILFLIAMSTVKGFPIADAIEKTTSFAKKFGGKSYIEIQATLIDISISGSNQGSHSNILIC